jgi:hypothetical protein
LVSPFAPRAARDGANIAIAAMTSEPHPSLPGTIRTAARQIEQADITPDLFVPSLLELSWERELGPF